VQVRVTGGIQQMLPSFLPSFLFGAPVALDKLVLDNERQILYSLDANSAIQVRCRRLCSMCEAVLRCTACSSKLSRRCTLASHVPLYTGRCASILVLVACAKHLLSLLLLCCCTCYV
jgi:hypothetical protein